MDEPTTKPSGSNPASPSSTYSDTDRSEVKTPDGSAPAVLASRLSAACGSHTGPSLSCCPGNSGIVASSTCHLRARKGGRPSLSARQPPLVTEPDQRPGHQTSGISRLCCAA